MQADQILYLHPLEVSGLGPGVDVDGDELPDVTVEVDYSTDARVRKLRLFEAWGFPEVWVDVPDERSRPRSRLPGLTIHVLEAGRYRTASASRAFPGWTAVEIHRALNEQIVSRETLEALRRVGRRLGASEGTGPDDDPWLRSERAEGRVAGRAEGLAEGRADLLRAVAGILEARRVPVSRGLVERLADLDDMPAGKLVRAAQECASEEEFLRLLPRRSTSS